MREPSGPHGHSALPTPAGSVPVGMPPASEPGRRTLKVLMVCTGNICRSPAAAALLRHRMAALGSDVLVRSAGLLPGGRPMDPVVIKVLCRQGLRLPEHRSTALLPLLVAHADLVLGMAFEHVEAVVAMSPEKRPRTFTLRELVRRSDSAGGPRGDETVDAWLVRLHSGRVRGDLQPFLSQNDDLFDPVGRSLAHYEAMIDQVVALTARLAELLAQGAATEEAVPVTDSAPSVGRDLEHMASTLGDSRPLGAIGNQLTSIHHEGRDLNPMRLGARTHAEL